MLFKCNKLQRFTGIIHKRQGAVRKRVKGDREKLATLVGALDDGFELSIHEVHYHRLVPLQVRLPTLLGDQMVRTAIVVLSIGVGLLDDPVEVLMKTVKQVSDEFP